MPRPLIIAVPSHVHVVCLLWQGFFFVFLVFAFWYLASSSAFPADLLVFLWQAGIGRLWSSSSSSSYACPVVDFVFGFLVRLSRSAFSFGFLIRLHRCLRLRLRLVSSFNGTSRSPSSDFDSIMFAIKIALMLSWSWSSRHPFILFHASSSLNLFITCVLGVMFLIGVRLTCASGHKKSEVEFQLCRCAFLESGCTGVQNWPGPG